MSSKKLSFSERPNPEAKANPFSRLFYGWVTPLVTLGNRKFLDQEDLFSLNDIDRCDFLSKRYSREIKNARKEGVEEVHTWAAKKMFLKYYLTAFWPKLLATIALLGSPFILQYYLEDLETHKGSNNRTLWYVFGFLITGFFSSLGEQHHVGITIDTGLRLRATLIDQIFKKSLKINLKASPPKIDVSMPGQKKKPDGKQKKKGKEKEKKKDKEKDKVSDKSKESPSPQDPNKDKKNGFDKKIDGNVDKIKKVDTKANPQTLGLIVNLMSNDTFTLMIGIIFLHQFWSGLVILVVSIVMYIKLLGWSGFFGIVTMILLFPINGLIMQKLTKFYSNVMLQVDSRVKLINEMINAIKLVKLYAWEKLFNKKISDVRETELKQIKNQAVTRVFMILVWTCQPLIVATITFLIYVGWGNDLKASIVFTAIAFLNIMGLPLIFVPYAIAAYVQGLVSWKRIKQFLNSKELGESERQLQNNRLEKGKEDDFKDEDIIIKIRGASFNWEGVREEQEETDMYEILESETLDGITLDILPQMLTMVVGPVGSGKSALLSAILGEIPKTGGSINVKGSMAYSPQEPWIQNATVKDNILLYNEMNNNRYDKVIKCCALEPDLNILPAGDLTEIGEKGVNLSGGQKARISLARTVYTDNNILLLDDPLSAVDSHVGKHIFDNCIKGELLKTKTVILVTHQLQYLPQADDIIVINQGKIIERGTYQELMIRGFDFNSIVENNGKGKGKQGAGKMQLDYTNLSKKTVGDQKQKLVDDSSSDSDTLLDLNLQKTDRGEEFELEENKEPVNAWINLNDDLDLIEKEIYTVMNEEDIRIKKQQQMDLKDNAGAVLIDEEARKRGAVKWKYYKFYIIAAGGIFIGFLVFFGSFLSIFSSLFNQYWLAIWIDEDTLPNKSTAWFLTIYILIGAFRIAIETVKGIIMAFGSVKASRNIHNSVLNRIMKAPMSFFDTTPAGRILNRFNKDQFDCDIMIFPHMDGFLSTCITIILTLLAIASVTPLFLIPAILLGIVYYKVLQYYRSTNRDIKRLENVSRSPIINNFSAVLNGLPVIRSYKIQGVFKKKSRELVNKNSAAIYCEWGCNRWLGVRVELIGTFLVFFAALFIWIAADSLGVAFAGLALSYSMQVSALFNWVVRNFAELEKAMNSIERLRQYSRVKTEKPYEIPETAPGKEWPENGFIEFKNISMRYREGLDPVLKKVSAKIKSNEKIGIVGRTGSGKSSLVLCIFRIVELFEGKILIDGVDISTIGLHELRGKLSIIPQDPVLFTGSIRDNLDPFGELKRSDKELWTILEQVYLKEKIQSLENKLDQEISQESSNFSVGEKQLFCLARALARKSKILILDEATASVDTETDTLIQKTIRKQFKDCTMITIAHRLNTIMDSDRIIGLEKGELVEFDTPKRLLQNQEGLLTAMVLKTGKENAKKLKDIAYGKKKKYL
ncbi:multidrug-resistance like protein 1 isoform i [Anaeramoeba flamelloides]|uniref:Multidrug-resistance like protein 1 isoform i n=1 Tax=Anaeramoeba flamelloides TaxID=1746091 RepID=A0AAV7YCH5_9EUKA|nr:multidrug-resistance like protein 1 isoform i [Anaeramoeba flamelloides]